MKKKPKYKTWEEIEGKLEIADIILVHTEGSAISSLIQGATDSYWNHSALVFTPSGRLPFGSLVVEAVTYGIEIHQLSKYVNRPDKYTLGVLRYPGLTDKEKQNLVESFILNHIDTPYDFSRFPGLLLDKIVKAISKKLYGYLAKKLIHPNLFVCSTFIHTAFEFIDGDKEHESNKILGEDNTVNKHHFYTPKDLAKNKSLIWLYNKHT